MEAPHLLQISDWPRVLIGTPRGTANGESLMVGAFSRNVGARVRLVAGGALVRRSVPVLLCEFAILQLTVYEFE